MSLDKAKMSSLKDKIRSSDVPVEEPKEEKVENVEVKVRKNKGK